MCQYADGVKVKICQYFVIAAAALLAACADKPVPEDSFVITMEDFNRVSVDTVESLILPVDTLPEVFIAGDTLIHPDSLLILPDSLISDSLAADSISVPEDSLPSESAADLWMLARIEIQGSLYSSLSQLADVNPDILGAHCVRYLVWEMNPWSGFIAGDSICILYDPEVSERENMVMAIRYIPVAGSSNSPFSAYTFTRSGDNWPSAWLADGTELVKLLDRMPIRTFEEITSVYGEPRGDHSHAGVDYKAPEGTAVFSVTGGTVSRTNWNTPYNGDCIEIDFGGYSELFLHLHSIDSAVFAGAVIEAGQQVGTVGSTGISTAPHLHYQINDPQGYSIDPYLYFSSHRRTLSQADMDRFGELVDRSTARMNGEE